MTMSDAAAEACVAYLLDQLVSDGRDPAEAVTLMFRAIGNWSEAHPSEKTPGACPLQHTESGNAP